MAKSPNTPALQYSSTPFLSLQLYLHIHTGRDVELAERVDGLLGRLQNIEEPFVGADLELISGFFIDVGRAIDGKAFDTRRQRDGARDSATGAPDRLHNFPHRLVQNPVVVGFQPYTYFLVHTLSSDLPANLAMMPSATAAGTGS